MTFLPIVERELRVVARLRATYWNRVIIAGAVIGVAMIMLVVGAMSRTPFGVGHAMFWTLTYMALAFCLFEGVRKTADCLSEEKREGTLGLLFLTDLKGYDIILGKLTAKSLNSVYGLISVLPVLASSLLLGGTTSGEYWRVVLALLNILFFSLCAGIWVSCWCRDDRQAMTGTFLLVAVSMAAPLFVPNSAFFPLSPLYAIHAADDRSHLLAPLRYWETLAITQGLSWGMLIWASLAVPHCWRDEKVRTTFRRNKGTKEVARRARNRAKKLETNPVFWLASREGPPQLLLLGVSCVVIGAVIIWQLKVNFLMPYLAMCGIINFLMKTRVAAQACHCFAEARRNNALEMLLVTPLSASEILEGQISALQRSYTIPITVLFIQITALLFGLERMTHTDPYLIFTGFIFYFLFFLLDLFAVTWTGIWHGLNCKSESQAVTRTILLVLVLPTCCLLGSCFGLPFFVGLPIAFMSNARANLRHALREKVAQRFQMPTHAAGWNALPKPQSPPIQKMS